MVLVEEIMKGRWRYFCLVFIPSSSYYYHYIIVVVVVCGGGGVVERGWKMELHFPNFNDLL